MGYFASSDRFQPIQLLNTEELRQEAETGAAAGDTSKLSVFDVHSSMLV